jgi:hypothetical protein
MQTVEKRVFKGNLIILILLLIFFLIPGILYWYFKTEKIVEKRR